MGNFFKKLLLGTGFMAMGIFLADSLSDSSEQSSLATFRKIVNVARGIAKPYVDVKETGVFVGDVKANQQEGDPRTYGPENPLYMDKEEITEAQHFFNRLAGLDPEELAKQKEEKKKAEEDALKAAEEAAKKAGESAADKPAGEELPESLWPRKRQREGIIEMTGHKTGAIYNNGALPYGPPPFVKSEIFSENTQLTVPGDPDTLPVKKYKMAEDPDQVVNYGPDSILNLKQDPQLPEKITAPLLNSTEAYTVQMGAFESQTDAKEMANRLLTKGFNVGVYRGDMGRKNWYYVRLNDKETEQEAMDHAKEIIEQHKIFPIVVPAKKHERRVQ